MDPKSPKLLEDVADACKFVAGVTAGVTFSDYLSDRLLRQAVERNFEIIGEALLRIERVDPSTAARISDFRGVIGLRNRLAHGYDDIDNPRIWEIIQAFLPILQRESAQLLQEAQGD